MAEAPSLPTWHTKDAKSRHADPVRNVQNHVTFQTHFNGSILFSFIIYSCLNLIVQKKKKNLSPLFMAIAVVSVLHRSLQHVVHSYFHFKQLSLPFNNAILNSKTTVA